MEIALRCRPRIEPCLVEARVVISLDEARKLLLVCLCGFGTRERRVVVVLG